MFINPRLHSEFRHVLRTPDSFWVVTDVNKPTKEAGALEPLWASSTTAPTLPTPLVSEIYIYNLQLIQIHVHILLVCRGRYRVKVAKIIHFTFWVFLNAKFIPVMLWFIVGLTSQTVKASLPAVMLLHHSSVYMCSVTAALTNVLPEILYSVLVQYVALFIHHIGSNISIHLYRFDSDLILPFPV